MTLIDTCWDLSHQVFSGVSHLTSCFLICDLVGPQADSESQQQSGSNLSVICVIFFAPQQLIHLTAKSDFREQSPVSSRHLSQPPRHWLRGLLWSLPSRGQVTQVTWWMNTSVSPKVWPQAMTHSNNGTSLPACPSPLMSSVSTPHPPPPDPTALTLFRLLRQHSMAWWVLCFRCCYGVSRWFLHG